MDGLYRLVLGLLPVLKPAVEGTDLLHDALKSSPGIRDPVDQLSLLLLGLADAVVRIGYPAVIEGDPGLRVVQRGCGLLDAAPYVLRDLPGRVEGGLHRGHLDLDRLHGLAKSFYLL